MSVMRYEREDSAVTLCKWDHPASEQVTFYDAAVAPLLHSRAREQLAFGVLELEQSACAALSWSSSFHGSSLEQQLAASSANCSSPALWQQKSGITAKQNFCQGDFMGFALGRVMAASTADGMLAAASTPAQLLQLSSHMFRFTAQPPARSSQPDDQTAAASKQIAVLLHDSIEANPLAHARDSKQLCPTTGQVLGTPAAGPNAAYLPLSHNLTGKIYIAVIALRNIAAGAEVTVDRGTVTYSGHVAEAVKAVLSRADCIQLRGELRHDLQQQQQQQQAEVEQLPSVPLLQQQLGAAVATCEQLIAGCSSSNSSFSRLTAQLTRQLKQAMEIGQQLPAAAAATAAGAAAAESPVAPPATPPLAAAAHQPAAPHQVRATAAAVEGQVLPNRLGLGQQQPATEQAANTANRRGFIRRTEHATPAVATIKHSTASTALQGSTIGSPVAALKQAIAAGKQPQLPSAAALVAAAAAAAVDLQQQSAPRPTSGSTGTGTAAETCNPRGHQRAAAKRAAAAVQEHYASGVEARHEHVRQFSKRARKTSSSQTSRIQDLVQKLHSNNREVQTGAIRSLNDLACASNVNCDTIASYGAIPLLIAIMRSCCSTNQGDRSSSERLAAAAAILLYNLTCDSEQHSSAVLEQDGSIKIIVKLMCSSNQQLVKHAAELLDSLAEDASCHAAVITAGALPVLRNQLASRDSRVQLAASRTLSFLAAEHADAVGAETLQQAAAAVVHLLNRKAKGVQLAALRVLSFLAEDHPGVPALAAAIPKAVDLLTTTATNGSSSSRSSRESKWMYNHAIEFLFSMSQNEDNLDAMAAAGSIEVLVKQLACAELTASTGQSTAYALGAIYNLVNEKPERQHVAADAGLVMAAVKLLQSSNELVQADATGILWSMGESSSLLSAIQEAVQRQGAVPTLVRLLSSSSSNSRTQHNAAGALMVLARNNATIRAEAAVAIPVLVRLLTSSSTDVQEDAAGSLRSLAIDSPDNQAAIAAVPGAVEQLRVLMTSTVVLVAQNANAVLQLLRSVIS